MKILALYGSRFGQAKAVLGRIVRVLGDAGHSVTVVDAKAPPPGMAVEDYDGVVVAASIIMGRHESYVRRWAKANAAALAELPGAFVSVNGTSPESDREWRAAANRYLAQFLAQTGWRPRWTATFSGALRYSRYGPITRWIMKKIAKKEGGPTDTSRDYEFTDWEAVERFANMLAESFEQVSWEIAGPVAG